MAPYIMVMKSVPAFCWLLPAKRQRNQQPPRLCVPFCVPFSVACPDENGRPPHPAALAVHHHSNPSILRIQLPRPALMRDRLVTCLVAVKVLATSPNVSSEHPSKRRVARTVPVRCTIGSLPGCGRSFRPSFAARPSPAASQPLIRPVSLSPFVLRPPPTPLSSPRRREIVRRTPHHPVHRPSMPGELEPLPHHHCLHPPSHRHCHRHRHRLLHCCCPTVYPLPRSVRLIWLRLGSIAAYPVAAAESPPPCCRRNSIYPWCELRTHDTVIVTTQSEFFTAELVFNSTRRRSLRTAHAIQLKLHRSTPP